VYIYRLTWTPGCPTHVRAQLPPTDLDTRVSNSRPCTATTNLYYATTPIAMSFSSILQAATTVVDGGGRSFPTAYDGSVRHYQAPTAAYEKVFFFQASRSSQHKPDYSAGWIIADDRCDCNPVFIAHSLLCAIALVRDTLPPGTLDDHAWAQLVTAAVTLSTEAEIPPSAQPASATTDAPVHSSHPPASRRRTLSSVPSASSPKRRRLESSTPQATLPRHEVEQSPTPASDSESLLLAAPQAHVVNVYNHNRRAEQERKTKA
jgi:hypothetical protein